MTDISITEAPPRLLISATCGLLPSLLPSFSVIAATAALCAVEGDLLDPGLAVDAESELGHAGRNAVFLGRPGYRAGIQRHADTASAGNHLARRGGNGLQVGADLGERAGNLVHEQGAGHAARLRQVGQRRYRRRPRPWRRSRPKALARSAARPEVKPIAGVILDDQQAAGSSGDGQNTGQHRVDAEGDAKTSPQTAAVSMPGPTKPACAGSWPEPPPETSATLELVPVVANDHANMRIAIEARQLAARASDDAVDGFGDEVFSCC